MLKKFYTAVLPSQGAYCITLISNGRARNSFTNSIPDLIKKVEDGRAANVFVALSSFNNSSRRADNALFSRSFFIDLDVDPANPKKYPSKADALASLDKFVADSGLPPPVRVDSGGGIHAYWIFDEDVPIAEWKLYATKFKDFCTGKILIDPVVTADAARIMRAPSTFNYKTNPPNITQILDGVIHTYSFESFKEFLGEAITPSNTSIIPGVVLGVDADTAAAAESNFESVFLTIAEKCGTPEGCKQIEYIIQNVTTLSEPMWKAGLSIAWHCVDRDDAIHWISEGHPGYTPEKTIAKASACHDKPYSCDAFDAQNPGLCTGCPHRGKITNPLALGRQLKAAALIAGRTVQPLPSYMEPYARAESGAIYWVPPEEVDKKGVKHQDEPIQIVPYDFYPLRRVYNDAETGLGECLMMRYCLPKDDTRDFLIPMVEFYDPQMLTKRIVKFGVVYKPKTVKLVMEYLRRWADHFVQTKADPMRMQMGFSKDQKIFTIGHRDICADGSTHDSAASPMVGSLAKLLQPEGNYDVWKSCANELNSPGLEMAALGMFCGFGSPLMHLTETPGVTLCYTSTDSGVSKTGSLYAGMSVFGNPQELKRHGNKSATDNALVHLYLTLHSIMLGLDEVSSMKPETLAELIHRISQGQGKLRMMGSVNAMREHELSASVIAMMTSNRSIYDMLKSIKGSPDGEIARIIEFHLKKPAVMNKDPDFGSRVFGGFRSNFGFAGPEYMQHYFKVGTEPIKQKMKQWIDRFRYDFSDDSAYRFYESFVAATMTGGEMAREAGIIDITVSKVYDAAMEQLVKVRDGGTAKLNSTDYNALIGEFMNKYSNGILIINNSNVTVEPRGPLVARGEVHNQQLIVSTTVFKRYLDELQISATEFETATSRSGILLRIGKQRLSTGWKGQMSTPPIAVYVFNTPIDSFDAAAQPPST